MLNTTETKQKRQRVENLPTHNKPVDYRLKQIRNELGLNKADSIWSAICNEIRAIENSRKQ